MEPKSHPNGRKNLPLPLRSEGAVPANPMVRLLVAPGAHRQPVKTSRNWRGLVPATWTTPPRIVDVTTMTGICPLRAVTSPPGGAKVTVGGAPLTRAPQVPAPPALPSAATRPLRILTPNKSAPGHCGTVSEKTSFVRVVLMSLGTIAINLPSLSAWSPVVETVNAFSPARRDHAKARGKRKETLVPTPLKALITARTPNTLLTPAKGTNDVRMLQEIANAAHAVTTIKRGARPPSKNGARPPNLQCAGTRPLYALTPKTVEPEYPRSYGDLLVKPSV